jgi:UPF0271 protein
MHLSSEEVERCVLYQIGAVYAFCRGHGIELQHVKPHGALYNHAAATPEIARGIARAVARFSRELPLVGLASSVAFREAAADAGVPLVSEAFADRRYNPDGSLQSRSIPGSLLTDPQVAAEQALRLVSDRTVVAHDGTRVPVDAQSICFHGDTPGAPRIIAEARARLESAGIRVQAIRELIAV